MTQQVPKTMPNKPVNCHIALGANLPTPIGTPMETLENALKLFERESLAVLFPSPWYQSPAFPTGSGPDFVNGVVTVQTNLTPVATMAALHRIEQSLGRSRRDRWEARVCDLDLLTYGDEVLPDGATHDMWRDLPLEAQKTETPDTLVLPHPRLQDRAFVLVPLRDVAPDWVHPRTGQGIDALIDALAPEDVAALRQITSLK